MSILNIHSKRKRKYTPQKKQTNKLYFLPNVLQQDFNVSDKHKWLTDITYLPCKDGQLYLSCIKDLYDKSIIAHSISIKNDMRLVLDTLEKATPKLKHGLLLHSDQGSQYCSLTYQNFLKDHDIIGSMSRRATPFDNAPIESFFSLLKNEELNLYTNLTMSQMRKIVNRFIDYYNYERPQFV